MVDIKSMEAKVSQLTNDIHYKEKTIGDTNRAIQKAQDDYIRCLMGKAVLNEEIRKKANKYAILLRVAVGVVVALILLFIHWAFMLTFVGLYLLVIGINESGKGDVKRADEAYRDKFYLQFNSHMQRLGVKDDIFDPVKRYKTGSLKQG